MRSIKKLALLSVTSLVFSTALYAEIAIKQPLLVLDMKNVSSYPKNFRSTADQLPVAPNLNKAGLADLHIAGSAQFSERALEKVLTKLNAKKVVIIDLRQESHGYLNGNAISWFAPRDAINAGKSMEQIEREQAKLLNDLAAQKSVTIYTILKRNKEDSITQAKSIEYRVHSVNSEAEIAEKHHVSYERIYVQDHYAPSVEQVNRFIAIAKNIPEDTWVYFHCRGGAGRTTSFMLMYDMMHNAKQLSFDEILQRQVALGGKDLKAMPAENSSRYKPAVARLAFLQKFYEYAKKNNNGFETAWSD